MADELNLYQKLLKIRSDFGAIQKTGTNTGVGDGYKFVETNVVAKRWLEFCAELGLVMLPVGVTLQDVRPSPSGKSIIVTVIQDWRITDVASGESILIQVLGQGADTGDKAAPKALTNGMKYALLTLLQQLGEDPERDENASPLPGSATARAAEAAARTAARRAAAQPTAPAQAAAPREGPLLASDAQRRLVFATAKDKGLNHEQLKAFAVSLGTAESSKEWESKDIDKILRKLEEAAYVEMFQGAIVGAAAGA